MKTRIDIAAILSRAQAPAPSTRAPEDAPIPATPLALLVLLRDRGIALRPDGNRLYVDITAGNVTREMLEALRQHKEALLDLVEAFEERAAIAEYCAGLPRVEAEALAWQDVESQYLTRSHP